MNQFKSDNWLSESIHVSHRDFIWFWINFNRFKVVMEFLNRFTQVIKFLVSFQLIQNWIEGNESEKNTGRRGW